MSKENNYFKRKTFLSLIFMVFVMMLNVFIFYELLFAQVLSFIFNFSNPVKFVLIIFFLVMFCFEAMFSFILLSKWQNIEVYLAYKYLYYMLSNHKNVLDFVDDWNFKLFERLKIKVSVPVSINYIMFNLNPYQDIEIKHLNMKAFQDQFFSDNNKGKVNSNERNKNKKVVYAKKVLDEFQKIRNSLMINDDGSVSSSNSRTGFL